jgi:hypothetical protein
MEDRPATGGEASQSRRRSSLNKLGTLELCETHPHGYEHQIIDGEGTWMKQKSMGNIEWW